MSSSLPQLNTIGNTHSLKLKDFPLEIVTPFLHVNNDEKKPIPCGEDKFYLVGKHNESLILEALQNLQIPLYHQEWECR